jgi:macrodomain Ter protein organizer (MatP/YcbG family)
VPSLVLSVPGKILLLQEVFVDDNLNAVVVHSELQRSATQQLAIDCDGDVRGRLYADMATTIVDTVSNTIHRTVKEAVEAEQQMPPMKRLDKSDIKHTIVGNSTWQKLKTTTVVLTDTDSGTIEQIVVDQLAINPHLDA